MKSKLLMALIIGLSSLSLSPAYADHGNGNGNQNQGDNGNGNGEDNGGDNGNGGDHGNGNGNQPSTSCTGTTVQACGLNIVKSTCVTQSNMHRDGHEGEEQTDAEDDDREHKDDGEGDGHSCEDHDTDSPSNHPGQDFSFQYYYDGSGNMQLGTSPNPGQEPTILVSTSERLGTSPDGKITICHREGGARVTLNIPDDQINGVKAHGHGDHPLDTIGRCEDEDDNDPSRDTVPRQKLSQQSNVTTSVQGCLSAPSGTPVTVTLSNGQTWTGNAPGCNASGVSCSVPMGGSASGSTLTNNGLPNRGGVRTLR